MKKWISIGLAVVLIIGGGIVGWNKFFRQQSASSSNLTQQIRPKMVMTLKKGNLVKSIIASGVVESIESQELYFKTNGTIKSINIAEGAKVSEGQVLMELDNDKQRLEYYKAKNEYERAVINGTQSEVEEAKLNLKIAEDKLEETKLKAPFSGIVNEIGVEEDSYTELDQGKIVAKIIDDSSYQVEVNVDESDSRQLSLGQPARITLEALPGREFAGKVVDIGANAESESGIVTLPVTVSITEKPNFIKPGFSADVEIIVNKIEDRLVVPITAIFSKQGTTKAVQIIDGRPTVVDVETGITNGKQVVVEEGLKSGDKILINTYQFANSGTKDGTEQSKGGMIPGGRMMRGGGR